MAPSCREPLLAWGPPWGCCEMLLLVKGSLVLARALAACLRWVGFEEVRDPGRLRLLGIEHGTKRGCGEGWGLCVGCHGVRSTNGCDVASTGVCRSSLLLLPVLLALLVLRRMLYQPRLHSRLMLLLPLLPCGPLLCMLSSNSCSDGWVKAPTQRLG